jgi:hypothetical protein
LSFEPPAEESWKTNRPGGDYTPPGKSIDEIILPGSTDRPQPLVTLSMRGCSIKDRFDRSSTLAYNFSDGQSRMEFNVNARGPTLSDPGRFEFKGIGLRYTYKFQKIKSRKERCRFESPVQGLIGSAYNEFYLRDSDTVWQELHAKGLDFWN